MALKDCQVQSACARSKSTEQQVVSGHYTWFYCDRVTYRLRPGAKVHATEK